ncbi:MAG TPA: three-Cys-motif partner protein TcmP [Candidatus Dormibacteraeota bacterium]|jgi:three-Cys-motif partner protein|nr:three-Cys-motif partner protein TcmP [Candidatus Dormibacteraeota bacterium]
MDQSFYTDREQTAVKHRILERYLSAFVPIVGAWAADISYIDCLAGPWQSMDPQFRDTSFGTAIDVLRATARVLSDRARYPRMRCLFVERDASAFAKLSKFCESVRDIHVVPKNWDFVQHVSDVVNFVKDESDSFPFIFIDPKGWEQLDAKVIAPILRLNPGEVLVTFMTSWIVRFLSVPEKRFDRIFGSDLPRLVQLRGEEQEEELVKCYSDLIRRAGNYKFVCSLPVMKPSQDAFHFHMIYGTRHVRGVEVFKETEKSVVPFMHETRAMAQHRRRFENSGQFSLLGPDAEYKEKRFTQFRQRKLAAAKKHLEDILMASKEVLYDDAWATAMQYPTIMEEDLGDWLKEWKQRGLLEITNQAAGRKLARKGQKQFLRWRKS